MQNIVFYLDMEKKETDRNNRRKDKRQSKKRNKCLDKVISLLQCSCSMF